MFRWVALVTAAALASACADGESLGPVVDEAGTLTVDASSDWAFVRLGEPAAQVAVSERATSQAWDMAFFSTSVMLNGGAAGPLGVEGYCICQNSGATNAQLLAMTPESELSDFEAVDAAAIPADAEAWSSDVLAPAIAGWYAYNPVAHTVSADPSKVWKVRLAGSGYAKFHVTNIENATRTTAGRVTIEYAVQSAAGAAMGETKTAVLDATSGAPVHFDFARGVAGDASDWDIALEGFEIRINGGVSGTGGAGAVLASQSFAEMTDAGDAPAQIYRGDAFGGVFDEHRWYRYNLTGSHDITPTYDVYLIRRGADVYKVQLTGYYGLDGESRQITFRYEKIGG